MDLLAAIVGLLGSGDAPGLLCENSLGEQDHPKLTCLVL